MRTLRLAAVFAALLLGAAPALAQQVPPPVPERPAPELMPQGQAQGQVVNPPSRGATPAAPPGTGAPVPFGQQRSPYPTSPPDTVQGTGGSCVHPPCPQPPASR